MKKLLILAAVSFLLTGCATTQEGRPAGFSDWDNLKQSAYLGLKQLQEGNNERARYYFKRGLRNDPRNCQLNFFNGLSYQLQAGGTNSRLLQLAQVGYRNVIKFCPMDPWPRYYSGLIALHHKDYHLAEQLFRSATQLSQTNDTTTQFLKGYLYSASKAGDVAGVKKAFARLKGLNPNSPLVKKLEQNVIALRILPPPQNVHELRQKLEEKRKRLKLARKVRDKRQLIIDAVIILSREVVQKERGVNLLRGLQLQYGNATAPGLEYTSNSARTTVPVNVGRNLASFVTEGVFNALTLANVPFSTQIINRISIPSITYDLNIFNNNDEQDEILARPTLIAENDKTSNYFSGRLLILGIQGTQTGTIEKFPLGVDLKVTPHFEKDGSIDLQVELGRDFLVPTQAFTSFQQTAEALSEKTMASVVLHFGETAILSALSENIEDETVDKVPLLGKLPIIKYFFNRHEKEQIHTTLLMLLTPEKYVGFSNDAFPDVETELRDYYLKLVDPSTNLRNILQQLTKLDVHKTKASLLADLYSKRVVRKASIQEFQSMSGDKIGM